MDAGVLMDELKRRISEEFDERKSADLSDDLMKEIESSSGDIRNYADELLRVETCLQAIREHRPDDPDWKSVHEHILKGIEEVGMSGTDEKLLDPPMPDGSEDDAPADDDAPPSEKDESPADEEDDGKPRMRLTATRLKTDKKKDGESSGLLNIGALVQEHRASMVPSSSGGSLDIPPMVVSSAAAQPASSGSKIVPVVVVLGVLAVVAIAAVVGVKTLGRKGDEQVVAQAPVIDKAALEEELKQKILAELKAEGKIGAEAEAEASRKAQEMAQAEIDKHEATKAEAEATAGDEAGDSGSDKKRHAKKKPGGGTAPAPAKDDSAPSGGFVPKTTSSGTGGKTTSPKPAATAPKEDKPKTAADDLAAMLEGATNKKTGGDTKFLDGGGDSKPAATKPATDTSLPQKLDKAAIRKAMNKIQPKIMQCGKDKVGTVSLTFVVNGDGSVKSVTAGAGSVTSDSAVKSCIINVATNAKFDPFQNNTQSVVYHFVFAPKPGV